MKQKRPFCSKAGKLILAKLISIALLHGLVRSTKIHRKNKKWNHKQRVHVHTLQSRFNTFKVNFTIQNEGGKTEFSQIGKYEFELINYEEINECHYKFGFLETKQLGSFGHIFSLTQKLTDFEEKGGLGNNSVYEIEYVKIKGNRKYKNTTKSLIAKVIYQRVQNATNGEYQGLQIIPITSSRTIIPVLPTRSRLNIEILGKVDEDPDYLGNPVMMFYLLLFMTTDFYYIYQRGMWDSVYFRLSRFMFLVGKALGGSLDSYPISLILLMIIFLTNMIRVLLRVIILADDSRDEQSIKLTFVAFWGQQKKKHGTVILGFWLSLILVASKLPEFYHYSIFLVPFFWLIDYQRADSSLHFGSLLIRFLPYFLLLALEHHLPFYYVESAISMLDFNYLGGVDFTGFVVFLSIGTGGLVIAYFLYKKLQTGWFSKAFNDLNLFYVEVHGKQKNNPQSILKHLKEDFMVENSEKNIYSKYLSHSFSVEIKKTLFFPALKGGIIEARSIRLKEIYEFTSIEFKTRKLKYDWVERTGKKGENRWRFRLSEVHSPSTEVHLRVQELEKENCLNRQPLIVITDTKNQSIFEPRSRKVLLRDSQPQMIAYLVRKLKDKQGTTDSFKFRTILLKRGRVSIATEIHRFENLRNFKGYNPAYIDISFWIGGRDHYLPFRLKIPPFLRLSNQLNFSFVTGFEDMILLVFQGCRKPCGFVFNFKDNMNSWCVEDHDEWLEIDSVSDDLHQISLISELDVNCSGDGRINTGFFIDRDLICLSIGSRVVVWKLNPEGHDEYWRAEIGGMGCWGDIRITRFERSQKRLWFLGLGKLSFFGKKEQHLDKRGYVDLELLYQSMEKIYPSSDFSTELFGLETEMDEERRKLQ